MLTNEQKHEARKRVMEALLIDNFSADQAEAIARRAFPIERKKLRTAEVYDLVLKPIDFDEKDLPDQIEARFAYKPDYSEAIYLNRDVLAAATSLLDNPYETVEE